MSVSPCISYNFQGSREVCVDSPASTPVGLCQLQPVPVILEEGAFHRACTLLDVLDSINTTANDKQVTVLIGLDLSAAFDTVNHGILLERLQSIITDHGVHYHQYAGGGR